MDHLYITESSIRPGTPFVPPHQMTATGPDCLASSPLIRVLISVAPPYRISCPRWDTTYTRPTDLAPRAINSPTAIGVSCISYALPVMGHVG
jgi:hypothetical protein